MARNNFVQLLLLALRSIAVSAYSTCSCKVLWSRLSSAHCHQQAKRLCALLVSKCPSSHALHAGLFTPNDVQSMMDEVLKMQSFNHPHVMTLIGVCLDAGPGLALVMPYMANGSLLAYLKKERSNLDLSDDAELDAVKYEWRQFMLLMWLFKSHVHWLVSDIFGAKAATSNVPPDSPWNGISCSAEVCPPWSSCKKLHVRCLTHQVNLPQEKLHVSYVLEL